MKSEQINMFYTSTLLLTVTKHMAEFSFHSFNVSSKYSFIHGNPYSSSFSSPIQLVPTVVMNSSILEHTSNHAFFSSQSSPQIKDVQEIITVAFKFFTVHSTSNSSCTYFTFHFKNTCDVLLNILNGTKKILS